MKPNELTCTNNSTLKITTHEHKDFIMHFQKSMLLSLVKRKLLMQIQMECVMAELEKQHRKS